MSMGKYRQERYRENISKISNFHQLQSNFSDISKYFTENLRGLFPVKNSQLHITLCISSQCGLERSTKMESTPKMGLWNPQTYFRPVWGDEVKIPIASSQGNLTSLVACPSSSFP